MQVDHVLFVGVTGALLLVRWRLELVRRRRLGAHGDQRGVAGEVGAVAGGEAPQG